MPALENNRHELFAQGLVEGKSVVEAYSGAGYPRGRNNATRLRANESVQPRVAELHPEHRKRHDYDIDKACAEYEEHRLGAVDTSQYAAANGATAGKARLHGLDRPADAVHNTQINLAFGDLELARRMAYLLENGVDALEP